MPAPSSHATPLSASSRAIARRQSAPAHARRFRRRRAGVQEIYVQKIDDVNAQQQLLEYERGGRWRNPGPRALARNDFRARAWHTASDRIWRPVIQLLQVGMTYQRGAARVAPLMPPGEGLISGT